MAGATRGQDLFWKKALNDPVEAWPTFEYLGSESTRSGIALSREVHRTLFGDNGDEEGSTINPGLS